MDDIENPNTNTDRKSTGAIIKKAEQANKKVEKAKKGIQHSNMKIEEKKE